MIASLVRLRAPCRVLLVAAFPVLGALLSGCAGMSDNMTGAFADPAKYDLYDCKDRTSHV